MRSSLCILVTVLAATHVLATPSRTRPRDGAPSGYNGGGNMGGNNGGNNGGNIGGNMGGNNGGNMGGNNGGNNGGTRTLSEPLAEAEDEGCPEPSCPSQNKEGHALLNGSMGLFDNGKVVCSYDGAECKYDSETHVLSNTKLSRVCAHMLDTASYSCPGGRTLVRRDVSGVFSCSVSGKECAYSSATGKLTSEATVNSPTCPAQADSCAASQTRRRRWDNMSAVLAKDIRRRRLEQLMSLE